MAYGQCRLMKSYPLEPQKHIQRFDEAFPHVLYGVLKEKNSLPGFCHPAVLSLWQSHMEQDLTLIHNLKCYLINGRNIAETARTLHLHRNTLIYRLRKIEDLLHISLDYLDENMLLYLLYPVSSAKHSKTDIALNLHTAIAALLSNLIYRPRLLPKLGRS